MNAGTNGGSWKHSHAAELEREGDQLRADMDRTLEDIERELTPDKLMDRSMAFFREHGSDFVREAGDTIRRHPLPVLLTAAGVVWLTAAVASSRSDSSRSSSRSQSASFESSQRRRRAGDGGHIDTDMASFDEFAAGQGYAESGQSHASEDWRPRDWQEESHWHEESRLVRLVREQPIALGALALAAGALIGAALPMSEYENRMIGPARGRFALRGRDREYDRNRDEGGTQSAASREAMTDE